MTMFINMWVEDCWSHWFNLSVKINYKYRRKTNFIKVLDHVFAVHVSVMIDRIWTKIYQRWN